SRIHAAVVRSDAGVSADVEEPVGAAPGVTIDIGAGSDGERNPAAYEHARAESNVSHHHILVRALQDSAEDEIVSKIKCRKRALGVQPRGERRRKRRVEIGLIVDRFAVGVARLEREVITEPLGQQEAYAVIDRYTARLVIGELGDSSVVDLAALGVGHADHTR